MKVEEEEEEKAGQVAEASLIATRKKGTGFVSKNGHAGLFFESNVCSSPPTPASPPLHRSPRPSSRQVQNRLYLLWEEEEKMCSVIRLPAASQEN